MRGVDSNFPNIDRNWAISFNIHTPPPPPPPWVQPVKFCPLRKKVNVLTKNMPQKFVHFPFTRQKYRRDQRMPTGLTPQNDFGVTLQKSSSMGGGGGH